LHATSFLKKKFCKNKTTEHTEKLLFKAKSSQPPGALAAMRRSGPESKRGGSAISQILVYPLCPLNYLFSHFFLYFLLQ
jgi:hypothetical protein